jgi:phenylalanyl-tRNA synthetase beta chain
LCERLEALGVATVNNVVDITNFVLWECNQPLHAFDMDVLEEKRIIVRRARADEVFHAINDKEYTLDRNDLVIADGDQAVALAGVMGGKESEVSNRTRTILLESAAFDPVSVRRTSRRLKLQSDSSFRFERGVDRSRALEASRRAAALILDLCGGTVRQQALDVGGPGDAREAITLRVPRVERICGIRVKTPRVLSILESLECDVKDAGDDVLQVIPPTFRPDLFREIDLIEEVIRVHGFEHLPEHTGLSVRATHEHAPRAFRERVKDRMAVLGLTETLTPNFVREGLCGDVAFLSEGAALRALAPVRAGEGALRRSLLPSLLEVRKRNYDVGNDDLRVFEISNLHFAVGGQGAVPEHVPALGILLDGDFRDGRGVLEGLADHLGLRLEIGALESPGRHAGSCGAVLIRKERVGVLGYPSADLLRDFGLKRRPLFGEVRLDALREASPSTKTLDKLPRFPAVSRDLSLVVGEDVTYGIIEARVKDLVLGSLESISLFGDVYRAKQIGDGKKNLVMRLVFRSKERTLTAEEVDQEIARLVDVLCRSFNAALR